MTQWEYLEVKYREGKVESVDGVKLTGDTPVTWLEYRNQKGREGWECYANQLIAGAYYKASFKRPIEN